MSLAAFAGAALLLAAPARAQRHCAGAEFGDKRCFPTRSDCVAFVRARCGEPGTRVRGGLCPNCVPDGGEAGGPAPSAAGGESGYDALMKAWQTLPPQRPDPKLRQQGREAAERAAAPPPSALKDSGDELRRRMREIEEAEENPTLDPAMPPPPPEPLHFNTALNVKGDVQLCRQDGCRPMKTGDSLKPGDEIRTGRDGACEIRVNRTVVRLSAATTFELNRSGTARLLLGSLKARLEAGLHGCRGSSFWSERERRCKIRFEALQAVAAVRGTGFQLVQAPDGLARLSVVEGVVEWSALDRPKAAESRWWRGVTPESAAPLAPGPVASDPRKPLWFRLGDYLGALAPGSEGIVGKEEAQPLFTLEKGRLYLRPASPGAASRLAAPGAKADLAAAELEVGIEGQDSLPSFIVLSGTATVHADESSPEARKALGDWPVDE